MKTAIYIDNGILQVVLTPEMEDEKRALDLVENKDTVKMYRANFYECQGYMRQMENNGGMYGDTSRNDSLILVLKNKDNK